MRQCSIAHQIVDAASSSRFRVPRSKDDAGNSSLRYCPGAHYAWFEGDHKRVAREIGCLECVAGQAKRHNFGVSGRVMVALFLVARLGDNHSGGIHDESGNGNIARVKSLAGNIHRKGHQIIVGRHVPHFIQLREP
jgi:hypothetical protein